MTSRKMDNAAAWQAIRSLRAGVATPAAATALAGFCGAPRRCASALPYESWHGDIDGALSAALLPFAGAPVHYPPRTLLFMEGQMPPGIWLLVSGVVSLTRSSRAGKKLTLRLVGTGAILGLSAALAQDVLRMAGQTAVPSTLSFLAATELFALLGDGETAMLAAQALGREAQAIYSRSGDLLLARSAQGRLARVLLSLPVQPAVNHRAANHQQLADLAGCSRETVTRLLGRFQAHGLVCYPHGNLRVADRSRMAAFL